MRDHRWLIADGCRLRIDSPHGPLYDMEIHELDADEIVRWIRPERVLDDGDVSSAQAFRLIAESIPEPRA